MSGDVFAIIVIVGCLAFAWWFSGKGGSRGIEMEWEERQRQREVRRMEEALKGITRKPDEEALPEWVVKARREMEKRH